MSIKVSWYTSLQKYGSHLKEIFYYQKEIFAIVPNILKFQDDLVNKKFLLRINYHSTKGVIENDAKNLASKEIFVK